MIQTKSKEEAVEWARRVPAAEGDVIEIRQVFEMSDFPQDVQPAADSPAVRAQVRAAEKLIAPQIKKSETYYEIHLPWIH